MPKPIIYLAGPISGVDDYRDRFGTYKAAYTFNGYIVLNPAELPDGMPYEKAARWRI